MRLVIDAMGGDFAPGAVVRGAVQALGRMPDDEIVLVGDREAVRAELNGLGAVPDRLEVVHASQRIGMAESPVEAVRGKPDSSMRVAVRLMASGEADACISAGNTGAFVAAAHMVAKRLPGIRRPGIAVVFPTLHGPVVMIDVGANVDCRPTHLLQYGLMASLYSRKVMGVADPRVGILSIGEESAKGNELAREARELLEASALNFRGNAEGRDIFSGRFDVIVCDGFVGNVILKSVEALAASVLDAIREEVRNFDPAVVEPFLPVLDELTRRHDSAEYGGAPLLGVNGVVVICHGNADAKTLANACRAAAAYARTDVNGDIVEAVAGLRSAEA